MNQTFFKQNKLNKNNVLLFLLIEVVS